MTPVLPPRAAVKVFLAFAFAYFLSALLRAVTATLAPTLATEFSLQASDLGLLAGGFFLGFAATQLPLGAWLDQHGAKKVALGFLGAAVVGCLVFSMATGFSGLFVGRLLCGAGVSACLMAPLTGYRRWFEPSAQLRVNSWMLMTGSLGMVASTLPVQWALPVVGWRPLFWALAVWVVVAMGVIALWVPAWSDGGKSADPDSSDKANLELSAHRASLAHLASAAGHQATQAIQAPDGYALVWRHPYFRRIAPLGFFSYGGMVAMQTLWAGPWMQSVAGYTPLQAATGLFWINASMLCTFWTWGMCSPWLLRRGWDANRLMAAGLPLSLVVLAAIVWAGPQAGGAAWALFCVSSTFVSLSQPALALAFPQALAGRALSAFNLVIFAGVFVVQWGIGLAVDAFAAAGLSTVASFQAAIGVYGVCNVGAYGWFALQERPHNGRQPLAP